MWIVLVGVVLAIVFYFVYLKDYAEVNRVFSSLEKTLDARDLLVMKLVPEIKDKKMQAKVVKLIEERMNHKNIPYNDKIALDIALNKELKEFYAAVNEKADNPVIKATFAKAVEFEKVLKKIRNEYNLAVTKYNTNLVMHKFVCMRIIRMKPLDTYAVNT
ncbi:MAG: hypothetical protein IJ217_04520 [Clostridia bacterium]|nr:hypothetical protein [Clostridia bacterium]